MRGARDARPPPVTCLRARSRARASRGETATPRRCRRARAARLAGREAGQQVLVSTARRSPRSGRGHHLADGEGELRPVTFFNAELLASRASQTIEPRATIVFRYAPFA